MGKKLFFFFLLVSILIPVSAEAFSVTSFIKNLFGFDVQAEEEAKKPFAFLTAVPNSDPKATLAVEDVQVVGDTALSAVIGPLGNSMEAAESAVSYNINVYTVRPGDTLSEIGHSFGVSVSTIRWANDIPRQGTIKVGQELIILPVSGVRHTIVSGDTIAKIAKKYSGDPDDILDFNGLAVEEALVVGSVLIIPDGEFAEPRYVAPSYNNSQYVRGGGPSYSGYYARPIEGGVRSQGLHGYNGVDLASPLGTPVYASASGRVIIARASGWNGGYGNYIVVSHPNGTQTLYSHLHDVAITQGVTVSQGQYIGSVGSTGKATGPHLHFEVRGAKNPF